MWPAEFTQLALLWCWSVERCHELATRPAHRGPAGNRLWYRKTQSRGNCLKLGLGHQKQSNDTFYLVLFEPEDVGWNVGSIQPFHIVASSFLLV